MNLTRFSFYIAQVFWCSSLSHCLLALSLFLCFCVCARARARTHTHMCSSMCSHSSAHGFFFMHLSMFHVCIHVIVLIHKFICECVWVLPQGVSPVHIYNLLLVSHKLCGTWCFHTNTIWPVRHHLSSVILTAWGVHTNTVWPVRHHLSSVILTAWGVHTNTVWTARHHLSLTHLTEWGVHTNTIWPARYHLSFAHPHYHNTLRDLYSVQTKVAAMSAGVMNNEIPMMSC